MLRTLLTFIVVVALGQAPAGATPRVQGGAGVEAALTKLVERYLTAIDKGDLEGAMSCWARSGSGYASLAERNKNLFALTEARATTILSISKWNVRDGAASARVVFNSKLVEKATHKPREQLAAWSVRFVREGGAWKLSDSADAFEEFAIELYRAESKEERARLLNENRELLRPNLARVLLERSGEVLSGGDLDDALSVNLIAFEVAEALRDDLTLARCYVDRASIFVHRSALDKALEDLRRAVTLFRVLGKRRGEANMLELMGRIHKELGRDNDALENYGESLKAKRDIGDSKGVVSTLNVMADIHRTARRYKEAIEQYEAAVRLAAEIGDRAGEAHGLIGMGMTYEQWQKFEEAVSPCRRALEAFTALADRRGEAVSHGLLANVYNALNRPEPALSHAQAGLALARALKNGEAEAALLGLLGTVYQRQYKADEAIAQFKASLEVAWRIGNKQSEGSALNHLAETYQSGGDFTRALESYNACLEAAKAAGNKTMQAKALRGIGDVYRLTGQYEKALEYAGESLKLAREIGDREGEGAALNDLGTILTARGEYDKALERYEESLHIAEEVGAKGGVASTLGNIATVYKSTGRYREALERHEASLKLRRELYDRAGEASTLGNIGVAYQELGRFDEALTRVRESLQIYREIGDRHGEVVALTNTGVIMWKQSKYAEALALYQTSLRISREIGDRHGEASALNNIGSVYFSTNKYLEAMRQFTAALLIAVEMGSPELELGTRNNIGILNLRIGNYEVALKEYEGAARLARALKDKYKESTTSFNLGRVYEETGDYERALKQYETSIGISRGIGDKAGEAQALNGTAAVYAKTGKPSEALARFQEALGIAESIADPEDASTSYWGIGNARSNLKQWREAAEAYRNAIRLIELARAETKEPDLQASFFQDKTWPYHALANCLLKLSAPDEEVFKIAEQAKARTLSELMSGGRADISKAMSAQERQEEQALNGRVIEATARLNDALAKRPPDRRQVEEARGRLEQTRAEYDEFRRRLFLSHPRLQAQRARFAPVTLVELGRALFDDPDICVLSYLDSPGQMMLFVITRGRAPGAPASLSVYPLLDGRGQPLTSEALRTVALDLIRKCANPAGPYAARARELYKLLVAPAEKELAGKKQLVVAPDGVLNVLPFQVLIGANGKHLIEEYSISYAPSVTSLGEMLKLGEQKRSAGALAPPMFAVGLGTFAGYAEYSDRSLPWAERQVGEIARLFGTRAFTGPEATKAKVLDGLGKARYVHLATHGELNQMSPMYSAIVLGKNSAGGDGRLYARELLEMDLRAELVVLSACETGLGQHVNGEGVVGLSWTLFVAGAPSSVVTLWKVYDDSTSELMVEFYRQLRIPGVSKADALRRAQLRLLKSARYGHPFNWAGPVLIGDWR